MLSFAYPAQAHVNHRHLLTILRKCGPQKSLKTFLEVNHDRLDDDTRRCLNIVLNNWHDVEFNRQIILNSSATPKLAQDPFFDSVGHALEIGLAHTIWMLAGTFDEGFRCMPDIRRWEQLFDELRDQKVTGYYYGSPINLPPIGARHIFEGQARFSQMQYLHVASGMRLSWNDFRKMGMLSTPYISAFQVFLDWSKADWPDSVLDPVVNLFLLTCDLAINPSDGFPSDIRHVESFIESIDPAFRFLWFARQVHERPSMRAAINRCTRDEYVEIAGELAQSLVCETPVDIAQRVSSWPQIVPNIAALLDEERRFSFADENLPVRVLFSQYLRFSEDRVRRPEFFCWPGLRFVSAPGMDVNLRESKTLFHRHEPMFFASIDGEVRPTLRPGKDESNIYDTFNSFYAWGATYDMVKQWTVNDGPFKYDYAWLNPANSRVDVRRWAERQFKNAFGVDAAAFQCAAGRIR